MLTGEKARVVIELEKLVGKRFSEESLSKAVSNIFNEDITVDDCTNFDNEPIDYNYMFNSEKDETYGYFDIYVLKMINEGFDGSILYVTEIGYEFEG